MKLHNRATRRQHKKDGLTPDGRSLVRNRRPAVGIAIAIAMLASLAVPWTDAVPDQVANPIRAAVPDAVEELVTTNAAEAHHGYWQQVWVGSPVKGCWNANPSIHHTLFKADNDWAVDISCIGRSSSARKARVYAAVSNGSDSRLTARVSQIIDNDTCRYGGGGDTVTVEFRYDGTLMGHATYSHLNRSGSLYVGKSISRWGGYLGKVSLSESGGSNCWTGPHVHVELRAARDYACWNRTYHQGEAMNPSNFIGFISGGALKRYPSPCP